MLFGVLFPLRQTRDNVNLRVAHYEFNYQTSISFPGSLSFSLAKERIGAWEPGRESLRQSVSFYLGAEVYERLNRRREEDKSRRKMLDDILANIQVKLQK